MKSLVTAFFIVLAVLTAQASAGTISVDVSGVLGPDLQGVHPLELSGSTITASGEIDPNALPIFISGDLAIYQFSGDLQIMLSQLELTGYDAMLTITAPPSGPQMVVMNFTVDEFGYSPAVAASFTLPEGTLNGSAIQNFQAEVTQPDGILMFGITDEEDTVGGTLGISGSVSIGGAPSSGVPEPGTLGLMGAGLALSIAGKMWSRPPVLRGSSRTRS